ncbi:MAG: hypothetical protein M3N28_04445 [Actinomycetota bacterium]|nr:hypothetical protein [Actinomycetota bacterium]
MRARRFVLLVLTAVVAVALPLLLASAWRPEGAESGEGTNALIEGPANAVGWLGVVFVWAVVLFLLVTFVRRRPPEPSAERELWEEE